MDLKFFEKNGYVVDDFLHKERLVEIQALVNSEFPGPPIEWHKQEGISPEQHVEKVKTSVEKLVASRLVTRLIEANKEVFMPLAGPDIDVQAAAHLRVTRPEVEGDMVDWHRDSFYGSTPWELNIWFPVFALDDGAGLRILPGSHVMPSTNIREGTESDQFRKTVAKGSAAHQIGFVYAPKIDDTLETMKAEDTTLISPEVGKFVIFFGCCVHKAQNRSRQTRLSVDVRIKSSLAPTNTRSGYYEPLSRGVVAESVRRFEQKAS